MKQENIINEIIKCSGNIEEVSLIGWHFIYNGKHYCYLPSKTNYELHFSMPHVAYASGYEINELVDVINETNLNVKFVKAVLLDNGSVSLDYHHKIEQEEQIPNIIPHIIDALDFASDYLTNKLNEL